MSVHVTELVDVELTDEQRKFLLALLNDFVMGEDKLGDPSKDFGWALIKKLI